MYTHTGTYRLFSRDLMLACRMSRCAIGRMMSGGGCQVKCVTGCDSQFSRCQKAREYHQFHPHLLCAYFIWQLKHSSPFPSLLLSLPLSLTPPTQVLFMQSDGGLSNVERFSGHKAVLSGPAGGYVGYALTTRYVVTPAD